MNSISENIQGLLAGLPPGVKVVGVTKTRTPEEALEAYKAGLRIFGENRVQEMAIKKNLMPPDISWHLIGHLQSNKVKQAVATAGVIESADTIRLLRVIDREASSQERVTDCLLQIHIASEETKSGFGLDEAMDTDWGAIAATLGSVRICGVMGMASFTDDMVKVRKEFKTLASTFRQIRHAYFAGTSHFSEISMGMSGDWQVAVEEGSTMIRVGTLIFGERIKR